MDPIEAALPQWRAWAAEWREAPEGEELRRNLAERERVRPALGAWLEGLRSGRVALEPARIDFDRRSRAEWRSWGLKGQSGAMFLNTLARHLDRHEEVAARLAEASRVPATPEEGGARIRAFMDYLEARIAAGDCTRARVHPRRAPFLLSSLWNVQDPSVPVYWHSSVEALAGQGLLGAHPHIADAYVDFARTAARLRDALGLSTWELEALCWFLRPRQATPEPTPGAPTGPRTWLIAAGTGARRWPEWQAHGIATMGGDELGDLRAYADPPALEQALRALRADGVHPSNDVKLAWQFSRELRPGDTLLVKRGRHEIVGVGTVREAYRYDPTRPADRHVVGVQWTDAGSWRPGGHTLAMKTLTEVTAHAALLADLAAAMQAPDPDGGEPTPPASAYTRDDALAELFLEPDQLDELLALLRRKKNLVLQGPPGTGKTFVASRLARLMVGDGSPEQVARVQFHQSMAYEDFVQGYRPAAAGGFVRRDGPFLRFCNLAMQDLGSPYVLLIDEINRGNLSRILGELMLLIEPDKRSPEWGVTLSYAAEDEPPFWVPPNVHLVGTMNTADRSLALVDHALRRRFAFADLDSAAHTDRFGAHLRARGLPAGLVARFQQAVAALNREISADPDLGPGFQLGHSYLCDPPAEEVEVWLDQVVRTELEPLLREYWFDAPERVEAAVARLLGTVDGG